MKQAFRNAAFSASVAVALAACSSSPVLDDADLEPADLVSFDETFDVERCWSHDVGGGSSKLLFALRPAVVGNKVYAASRDGSLVSLASETGEPEWEVDLDREITAGPGVGEGFVAVGVDDGQIVLLNAADGSKVWERQLSAEVVAAPAIGFGTVVVRTADGFLYGLSAASGEQNWTHSQTVPSLTLRGAGAPVIDEQLVYAGFDNGKVVALNVTDGSPEWELVVARPAGRSELERLVDVDGVPFVADGRAYVGSYQGRLVAASASSGREIWDREFSTYVGVDGSRSFIFAADANSHVLALDTDSGKAVWQQDQLRGRGLTAPVLWRGQVVVADADGYVHFLSARDGTQTARRSVTGSIRSAAVTDFDRLYLQNSTGRVYCYQEPAADES